MQKWKCTVCGYIHTGDQPPDMCPVCGADKSKFIVAEAEENNTPEKETVKEQKTSDPKASEDRRTIEEKITDLGRKFIAQFPQLSNLMTQYHAHPICVHIPNGVLPISVIFAVIAAIFDSEAFATAASINMIFVFFSMPFVLFSGYVDWINRFRGKMTKVFRIKMVCGALVTGLTFILTIWWMAAPDMLLVESGTSVLFLLLHVLTLIPAVVAGYYGGKLVFLKK